MTGSISISVIPSINTRTNSSLSVVTIVTSKTVGQTGTSDTWVWTLSNGTTISFLEISGGNGTGWWIDSVSFTS